MCEKSLQEELTENGCGLTKERSTKYFGILHIISKVCDLSSFRLVIPTEYAPPTVTILVHRIRMNSVVSEVDRIND